MVTALSAAGGFLLAGVLGPFALASVTALTGGAILAMIADTMIPEAFEQAHLATGLIAVLGFSPLSPSADLAAGELVIDCAEGCVHRFRILSCGHSLVSTPELSVSQRPTTSRSPGDRMLRTGRFAWGLLGGVSALHRSDRYRAACGARGPGQRRTGTGAGCGRADRRCAAAGRQCDRTTDHRSGVAAACLRGNRRSHGGCDAAPRARDISRRAGSSVHRRAFSFLRERQAKDGCDHDFRHQEASVPDGQARST